jgi:hypothetical protein
METLAHEIGKSVEETKRCRRGDWNIMKGHETQWPTCQIRKGKATSSTMTLGQLTLIVKSIRALRDMKMNKALGFDSIFALFLNNMRNNGK